MSSGAVLRALVSRSLEAVSREVLAAVDSLVSGYEEQILRQQEQLELLQVHISVSKPGVMGSRSLGPVEEEEDEEKEDESTEHPEASTNESPSRCQYKKRNPGGPQISETQNHVDLRIRILEDSRTDVLSNNVLKKSPVLKLRCPRGLREPDFVALLRSAFPQLSGDDGRFDVLTSDKRRRLKPLRVKTLTAEEIHKNVSGTGRRSTLYIRLKKEPQTREEETHHLQTNDNDAVESLQTCDETRLQTSSSVQEVEGSREDVSIGSTSQHQDMETEEADDEEDGGTSEPAESKRDGNDVEKEEVNHSDDDWKQEKSDEEPKESDSEPQTKTRRKEKDGRSAVNKTESSDVLCCKVCGALHQSEVAFIRHARSHADDPGSLCGVCGELSESADALRGHLQSRHKTEDCPVCGESFLGCLGLDEHVAAHSGEKPYECDVCHDAFALKATLQDHQRLHKAGKLNKCYTCHKVFSLKEHLSAHRRTHTNKKTHLCGVCGKSLSDYRSLTRHKMTHSGERPHGCQICGRRFKLPGTLRQHEKIHADRERSYLCDVCCKMFLTSKQLQIHLRTHSDEKPYHCGECGRGFTTKGPLTIHMRVHTGETPYRCPDCGWAFKRKINLDNHVTIHSGLKPFVCGICGKACARKSYLTVHMRTHNGERPYKCSLCDKAFTQSHCLKTHMKSHPVVEAAT
ncbi:zinc finger protein 485-like [Anoplopoma fimbria]|uniref:zinc finger protein 485-like n=1 Tax=Anoplopoma fimbria TaxID=229290 RepID=UPI0023EA9FD4|nr:zinc finger protein 485-like [Anoplopoma fimbria]